MAGSADEILKHRLASKLEAQKWRYRKAELAYLEAGQHMRSLNQIMWQVPSMAIAITGGIWYGVTTLEDGTPKILALCFAGLFDLLTVPVVLRIRWVVGDHIKKQASFIQSSTTTSTDSPSRLDEALRKPKTVVYCWVATLCCAAILSFMGAANSSSLTTKSKPSAQAQPAGCAADLNLKIEVTASIPAAAHIHRKIASSTHQCQ